MEITYLLTVLMPVSGVIGLLIAYKTYLSIEAQPAGSERMQMIANDIRTGALTFLKKESFYLVLFISVVFILLFFTMSFNVAISYVVDLSALLQQVLLE